jgi:hypothetical protein
VKQVFFFLNKITSIITLPTIARTTTITTMMITIVTTFTGDFDLPSSPQLEDQSQLVSLLHDFDVE